MRAVLLSLILSLAISGIGYSQDEGPLSMENCIRIALSGNSTIIREMNNNQSADAGVTQSWSGILPTIDVNAAMGRTTIGEQDREGNFQRTGVDPATGDTINIIVRENYVQPSAHYNRNQLGVSLNQTIINGGEWWDAINYAKSQKRSADFNLEATINTTVYSVQEAYYNLLKQIKLLEVNQGAVGRSQDNLDKTEKMFELGAVAKVDVYRSRVNLGNDKIQLLLQENALLKARQSLNLVMGRDAQTPVEIENVFELKPAFNEVDELYNIALVQNPTINKGEEDIYAYDVNVTRARAGYWPALSLNLSYNRDNEFLDKVYSGWDKNWSTYAGLSLRWNIFRGFSEKAQVQKNKLAMRNAQETQEESKRNLKSDLVGMVDNFNSYLEIIELNKGNLEASQEEYRLADERYRIGSGTSLEVREAQVNLSRAEQTLVAAYYNARMTQADLERALGIIFDAYRETAE
jgi:outer membrane protein